MEGEKVGTNKKCLIFFLIQCAKGDFMLNVTKSKKG